MAVCGIMHHEHNNTAVSSVLKVFPVKITALLNDSEEKLILFFRESLTPLLLEV